MIHISRPDDAAGVRRTKVVTHRMKLYDDEVTELNGIRLTTRERTWLDLAEQLSVPELVVIADHLIRNPRPEFEGRTDPFCTKNDLQRMINRHPGKRGIRKARAALDLARVGADSPPETMLRLALLDAGLPEPELNAAIIDESGRLHHEPDMSYRDYKIGVEYDGGHHGAAEQIDRDIGREEHYRALGWTEVRISKRHMANDAQAAVAKIRSALVQAGWRPERGYT